ncbi:AbiTii domain-containing protein [Nonomuraea candida]|uniref:AbiTii domain-containing protein n=1 Tax=Nonomuraea candida TaxID=359159 RepID=UPI000A04CAA9|nr:hypothetical protein [Nonomuraea candida]
MDRQAEALRVAEQLLDDIETKRLKASEIILKSSRLARLSGHDELHELLEFERDGYPNDGRAKNWIDRVGRRSSSDDGKFYSAPLVKIESSVEATRSALTAMQGGGNYSGEWASIAGREHDQKIAAQATALATMTAICGQVVSVVYGMVVEIYHELLFSQLQASLFSSVQTRVDGSLAAAGGNSLSKIEKISDRLRDGDPESVSQGLTTCRRLIDSAADNLFPPRESPFDIGGQEIAVGSSNVLNRLQAFVFEAGASQSRRDRIRRALKDLYGRCSAGTHAEVDVEEARFVFLQTYVILGEIMSLKDSRSEQSPG